MIGINEFRAELWEKRFSLEDSPMVIRSAVAALLLASCAGADHTTALSATPMTDVPALDLPASAQRGRAFAQAQCSACHAIGPEGTSPLSQAPPLRDLSQRYPVEELGEAFAEGFSTAHTTMPEFVLDAADNRDLIAYLASIQSRPAQPRRAVRQPTRP
ncbi:cytochrome c [Brevundimonas sp.]|uniref:c-type cytochrome n=1 Tax=Brevundimonas sp. TaxID=1871086 RepID=UPI0025C0F448|nr:cytochrome c [Brevundimonas sp.]